MLMLNLEKKNIARLKREADKARKDLEKKEKALEEAHDKVVKSLIALSNAKGKVLSLTIQEKQTLDMLKKTHYKDHDEVTRWWCNYCKTTD